MENQLNEDRWMSNERGGVHPFGDHGRNITEWQLYSNKVVKPWPSMAHWTRTSLLAEQRRGSSSGLSHFDCHVKGRDVFVSAAMGPRAGIRAVLIEHCLQRPKQCVRIETKGLEVLNNASFMAEVHALSRRSVFCLTPRGDTHTRRAFVDCLVNGAIPVIFKQETMDSAPFNDILPPSSYIASLAEYEQQLERNDTEINVVDLLTAKYSIEKYTSMLHAVHSVRHVFQVGFIFRQGKISPCLTLQHRNQPSRRNAGYGGSYPRALEV